MTVTQINNPIANLLPIPSKVLDTLPESALQPMLGVLIFAIGEMMDGKTNVKCLDQNRLDWHNGKIQVCFVGKYAQQWKKIVDSIIPPDLFTTKIFFEGITDNQLAVYPANSCLMLSDDPLFIHRALVPEPTVMGKSWRQAIFVRADVDAPTGDLKGVTEYLKAIASLPPQNVSLDSLAKLVFADQLIEFRSGFMSSRSGELWLRGCCERLIFKLALIYHVAGCTGVVPPKISAETVTQAFELAELIKVSTFEVLGVRF